MAVSLAAQIKTQLEIDSRLVPGSGGEFEVVVNGDLIYSKRSTGEFPDEQSLVTAIEQLS